MTSHSGKYQFFSNSFASYCPNSLIHSLDEHPVVSAYAGAKRRIAALEQQLQNLQEAGVKRKSYAYVLLHLDVLGHTIPTETSS